MPVGSAAHPCHLARTLHFPGGPLFTWLHAAPLSLATSPPPPQFPPWLPPSSPLPPPIHRNSFGVPPVAPPTAYTLPDGQEVPLTAERSLAPEALFTPALAGSEAPGLPALIAEAIHASPVDARRRLWSSVLLSGGSTLYRGFGGRLLAELAPHARPSVRVRVAAPAERRYLPFIGGSLVANLSTFRGMCVSAAEWREEGERVLYKKTFAGAPF